MRKKELRLSMLKKKLQTLVTPKKSVVWSLNKEQLEFCERLGYTVEPFIYSVKTSRFPNYIRKKYRILNDLHYASTEGRRYITYYNLKNNEKKVLADFNISYYTLKYRISR